MPSSPRTSGATTSRPYDLSVSGSCPHTPTVSSGPCSKTNVPGVIEVKLPAGSPARAGAHKLLPVSDREDLLKHIKDKAVVHGDVVLSSGQRASFYVDLRPGTLDARAAPLIGRVMLEVTGDLG